MSIFSQRVGILLLCVILHIEGVLGRGGRGGGRGGGDIGGPSSNLDLRPALYAAFALTIVVAVVTLAQLKRSLKRFKHLQLPEGEPLLPYDVGMLFRVLLVSYTTTYLLKNVLLLSKLPAPVIGLAFISQFSFVLFYGTLLSIIAYRQRIQLNPAEKSFNLKAFVDGWLLATILILGVARDGLAATAESIEDEKAKINLDLAFEVFKLLASLDVAISSFMAHARLFNAQIQDKIINVSAFVVSPIVVNESLFIIFDALLIATIVVEGIVSIATISCCLLMGAPPKPLKSDGKGAAVGKKV